ncbi:MAG: GNAT family N-acetyltransferase [Candidatus Promineifilaceae bacterium]|nr:GNAT family N-acetyltransferase [Chloroflexota bacterium]
MTMVITIPAPSRATNGPRPINLNKDIPQVLELLQIAFGESLDAEGRRALQGYYAPQSQMQPAILWRLNPAASRLSQGYVWEENGRVVGNTTLLTTRLHGRFLIVNVAVHPDYRRRGIARLLMQAVTDNVRQRGGREILLQVDHNNSHAIDLYTDLGYANLGAMTTWTAVAGRVHALENPSTIPIRELRAREWHQAYDLDRLALSPDLNWPEPILPDTYRLGFWRRVANFTNARTAETWVAARHERLVGMASIWSEWGRAHQLLLRVQPNWMGELERPLLAKALRRLPYLPRRNIRIDHPADDQLTNDLLREANFKPQRTLIHMRLDLRPTPANGEIRSHKNG